MRGRLHGLCHPFVFGRPQQTALYRTNSRVLASTPRSDVCAAFEKIINDVNTRKVALKSALRLELLLPRRVLAFSRTHGQSIFPYARLLMPDKDDLRRGKFKMQEKTTARCVCVRGRALQMLYNPVGPFSLGITLIRGGACIEEFD